MDIIPSHFKLKFNSAARAEAAVFNDRARFTVLTPRMLRMEWSPSAVFEDRASQAFWFRDQPAPEYDVRQSDGELVIETASLRLHYLTGEPFSADSLWIEMLDFGVTWHYGDPDPGNLLGTARTVDGVDGAAPLSLGLLSRSGWSLVDDSNSLVFNEDSWLEPRSATAGQLDLYFLGYGHDYLGCLREFNRVSGNVPMVPRYILGNWWSRYWEYSHDELTGLMEDFQKYQVPLSVCIIDMDWHITRTGNKSSGWTGYTWNRALFPDPAATLRFLHEKGLKVALNLHPADGIHPHEAIYAEMCEAVGQDPQAKEPVEFDITNPCFVEAYFRILHHPQEEMGIDFWWMDWQQGVKTRLSGLDPLWWLNHLHFLDLGRDGKRRSFIFSRWGGLGNHRYPIGFSGDSVVSWASLAFQPYFTSTSSNVNYGWWSHDIGGHMSGIEDAELYARWVQLGAFLPVLRLHSTKNAYHERCPWGYDANTLEAAREAMQLRHALIPYLYSMAWRYHRESIPMIVPMYYQFPEQDEAYACPNQYLFGDQLLVAPFITPVDSDTRLSRAVVWLPEGGWFDYFSGDFYEGSGWQAVYGKLNDIPVFARAGAIVPQAPKTGWGGIDTPVSLIVDVFPGADGSFMLYDDEGNSMDYLDGAYTVTPMHQVWTKAGTTLTIGPAEGDADLLPASRQFDLRFHAINTPDAVLVSLNGVEIDADAEYNAKTHTLELVGIQLSPADRLEVTLTGALARFEDHRLAACRRMVRGFKLETNTKADLMNNLETYLEHPQLLGRYLPMLSESQMRALYEVITGAGIDYSESTGEALIVLWNNRQDEKVSHQYALSRLHNWWLHKEHYPWNGDRMPRFQAFRLKADFDLPNKWVIAANYYGVHTVKLENK